MVTPREPIRAEPPSASYGKKLAREVFLKTMAALDVAQAMISQLERQGDTLVVPGRTYSLERPPYVVAFGKAANRMAWTLSEILGDRLEAGVVVAPTEPARRNHRLRYFTGGHPYPSPGSFAGAEVALDLLRDLRPDDLVIFLISGGGSAVFEKPIDPAVTLADAIEFNRVLVTSGLPIEPMNVLRKHLSAVKGGRLAARAFPARQLTIYISDVPEDLPSVVASGPTMPDESTTGDCYSLADLHALVPRLPRSIRRHFEERSLEETPKPGDPSFAQAHFVCLLSNRDAVRAARREAQKLGFLSEVDSTDWDRDFREVAQATRHSLDALADAHPGRPVALIVGGEVLCPVTGPGTGGRNQAFTLYAAGLIEGQKTVVMSAGTDGRDGNSPASGAVADGQTLSRARALNLDPDRFLRESDSYHFFRALGDTIETGFTDNNVRDLRLWLHWP